MAKKVDKLFILMLLSAGLSSKSMGQDTPASADVPSPAVSSPTELPDNLGSSVEAQTSPEEQSELNSIETEVDTKSSRPVPNTDSQNIEAKKIESVADLDKLAPATEISVIQKKFLPRTGRFQAYFGLSNIINDPWFFSIGGNVGLTYAFTEQWGVELADSFFTKTSTQSVKNLQNQNNVSTDSIVSTKNYLGVHAVWTPIYGKTTLANKKIIPFDMYFTLGGGSSTVDNGTGGTTFHVGTGQLFAISKSFGLRWDLSWNALQATPNTPVGSAQASSQNFNDIFISVGASFFFPEASYR